MRGPVRRALIASPLAGRHSFAGWAPDRAELAVRRLGLNARRMRAWSASLVMVMGSLGGGVQSPLELCQRNRNGRCCIELGVGVLFGQRVEIEIEDFGGKEPGDYNEARQWQRHRGLFRIRGKRGGKHCGIVLLSA